MYVSPRCLLVLLLLSITLANSQLMPRSTIHFERELGYLDHHLFYYDQQQKQLGSQLSSNFPFRYVSTDNDEETINVEPYRTLAIAQIFQNNQTDETSYTVVHIFDASKIEDRKSYSILIFSACCWCRKILFQEVSVNNE